MERELITGSKLGITIAVMCAAMMAVLDISIVNVALNDIRASFGTPIDQIAWVSTGYMMANVVVIPMTGWFQRRFGFGGITSHQYSSSVPQARYVAPPGTCRR